MIDILNQMPIILTKDQTWKATGRAEAGNIIYLPEDAVLVAPENVVNQSVDFNLMTPVTVKKALKNARD